MKPKSDNLFHFTKNLDYLQGILLSGFMPRYSLEDGGPIKVEYIGYPMVCFCDIPISRISEHTDFYGSYGLGMSKDWGLRNGLAPLVYTPPTGVSANIANYLLSFKLPESQVEGDYRVLVNDLKRLVFDFIPMIKPISGTMLIGGNKVEKDFSQENEWRYVPPHDQILSTKDFDERKDALNKAMEAKRLSFTPADVRYIFVKSDFEIPIVFDFIQTNLAHFPLSDIKILISRIVSLETLARDL